MCRSFSLKILMDGGRRGRRSDKDPPSADCVRRAGGSADDGEPPPPPPLSRENEMDARPSRNDRRPGGDEASDRRISSVGFKSESGASSVDDSVSWSATRFPKDANGATGVPACDRVCGTSSTEIRSSRGRGDRPPSFADSTDDWRSNVAASANDPTRRAPVGDAPGLRADPFVV